MFTLSYLNGPKALSLGPHEWGKVCKLFQSVGLFDKIAKMGTPWISFNPRSNESQRFPESLYVHLMPAQIQLYTKICKNIFQTDISDKCKIADI